MIPPSKGWCYTTGVSVNLFKSALHNSVWLGKAKNRNAQNDEKFEPWGLYSIRLKVPLATN
jgi:hypothetical protein